MPAQTPTAQSLTEMKKRCYSEPSQGRGRRSVRRPEDIQRDVRGLKLRQRVTAVLNDDFIRHELEDTLGSHGAEADEYLNESVRAYQDFLVPSSGFFSGAPGLSAVFPINDIRGTDTLNYTKTERNLRCKLAAAYRLVDLFGWSQNIYGHLTVRCPAEHGQKENFMINPFGLLYNEITASSLVKIDSSGNTLDNGSTNFGINQAGFVIHSAIHMARKDAKCVMHVHERSVIAVAASKHGILPITQEALTLGPISYHDYEGISCDEGERERLAKDFPEGSKVLILRNHGLLCVGETVEEAFFYTYYAVLACQNQIEAISGAGGVDNLIMVSEDIQKKAFETVISLDCVTKGKENTSIGKMEFEALMRTLDSQGHRTGYVYHNPDVFNKTVPEPKSEAKSPATMSSMRFDMLFGDNQTTPVRRNQSRGKGNTYKNRAKWLNSPVKATEYKKEIIQDNHSEPSILKDSQPEKDTALKILEESKDTPLKGNVVQEQIITSTQPNIVMSEIPLEDIFNTADDNVFIENGLNGMEGKESKPNKIITTEVTTFEVKPEGEGATTTTKQVVTMSRTVVKGDGAPVTTVQEKVIVNGEEQAETNETLLSPPAGEADVRADEGSDDGTEEKDRDESKEDDDEGGKSGGTVKKRRSFRKAFQGMMHRKSKPDKEQDEDK